MSSSHTNKRPSTSQGLAQENVPRNHHLPPPTIAKTIATRSRVPLSVKNVSDLQQQRDSGADETLIKPDNSPLCKQSPAHQHQSRDAHVALAPTSAPTSILPSPTANTVSRVPVLAPISTKTSVGGRYQNASYQPSPLSAAHRSPAAMRATRDREETTIVTTPKKRRVPLEDVHCRNVVQADKDESTAESPNKRSRSSNSNEGISSAGEPAATSTSIGISAGMGDLQVQAHQPAKPSQALQQRSLSSHTSAQVQTKANAPQAGIDRSVDRERERERERDQKSKQSRQAVSKSTAALVQSIQQQRQEYLRQRQTTVRIDKQSRISEAEKSYLERQKRERTAEWRRKFIKAFPNFRFYLDNFDDGTRQEVIRCIEMLNGTIEPFFSNKVTHLVTTRKVPIGTIPSDASTPKAASVTPSAVVGGATLHTQSSRAGRPATGMSRSTAKQTVPGQITTQNTTHAANDVGKPVQATRGPSLRRKNHSVPLHSDRNPFEECGPPVPSNDILVKAKSFNIKVWTQDKFRQIISGLLGDELDSTALKRLDLSQMLEKEKLQGTLDRDPTAARPDYHYFAKNAVFLLVEDATAEHRPIMVQEFPKQSSDDQEPPWPVLHGQLEGRCPFTKFDLDKDYQRRMRPNRHETLRRSVSLNHLYSHRGDRTSVSPAPSGDGRAYSMHRGASPYPMASGNSVSITSNIASTTSTAVGGTPMTYGKQVAQMGRKMYQPTGIGLGRPSSSSVAQSPRSPMAFADAAAAARGPGDHLDGLLSAEQARGTLVRRMLGMSEHQNRLSGIRRSVSTASAGRELRKEKRPGYCENCRAKYDDFDEHVAARRHRRFALDDANFVGIDELLSRVRRPLAPWADTLLSAEEEVLDGAYEEYERKTGKVAQYPLSMNRQGDVDIAMTETEQVDEKEEEEEERWQTASAPELDVRRPSPTLAHLDRHSHNDALDRVAEEARWVDYESGESVHEDRLRHEAAMQEESGRGYTPRAPQPAEFPRSATTEFLSSAGTNSPAVTTARSPVEDVEGPEDDPASENSNSIITIQHHYEDVEEAEGEEDGRDKMTSERYQSIDPSVGAVTARQPRLAF